MPHDQERRENSAVNNFLATCADLARKHDNLYQQENSGYLTVAREFDCCNPERFSGPSVHLEMWRFMQEFGEDAYCTDDYRKYIVKDGVFFCAVLPEEERCFPEEVHNG
jgi:hypothetical protein